MEFILNVKTTDLKKLEEANIDFLVDDIFDLISGNDKVDITIDGRKDFDKAKKLLSEV